jgi:hypothetical protein
MTPTALIVASLLCWNLTALAVNDNVFVGTRTTVLDWLDRLLGSLGLAPGAKSSGLLGVEHQLIQRQRIRYLTRRQRIAPLVSSAEANLEDSRAQQAIVSGAWWRLVLAVTSTAGTLFFPHHLPPFLLLRLVSSIRLLFQKLYEGLHCPFCVSVWLAVPSIALAGWRWPTWREVVVYGLAVSAISRLIFHLTTLATATRAHFKQADDGSG